MGLQLCFSFFFPLIQTQLCKMAEEVAAPAAEFAPAEIEEFKESFGLFDRVGDSQVGFNQVADIMRALGMNPTNKAVVAILGNPSADDMANKRVSFEAFLPMLKQVDLMPKGTYDDYVEGLRVFDKEGNGTVMGAELRIVLSTLGEKMSEVEIDALMTGQEDENGSVHYEDSPTVFRTSTLYQRPTKERQGLCTRDVEANPSCCLFCISCHLVSNPPFLGTSPPSTTSVVEPTITWPSLHPSHGVRNGGEGMTAHQVRVDPSLPTATTSSHVITGPAMPKVLGSGRG
ncbi:hypothetical protein F7725_009280 [Dissostichus mawsoni]|uniref:EF-hand domain-containing protein n=1 Tax=Dissostichus mawsoni TaxID=36200 RepID=A0A7J5Z8F1_DISMA|nr:hypothetical protein F7725_009280 [Dissostichus mawsoni]